MSERKQMSVYRNRFHLAFTAACMCAILVAVPTAAWAAKTFAEALAKQLEAIDEHDEAEDAGDTEDTLFQAHDGSHNTTDSSAVTLLSSADLTTYNASPNGKGHLVDEARDAAQDAKDLYDAALSNGDQDYSSGSSYMGMGPYQTAYDYFVDAIADYNQADSKANTWKTKNLAYIAAVNAAQDWILEQ